MVFANYWKIQNFVENLLMKQPRETLAIGKNTRPHCFLFSYKNKQVKKTDYLEEKLIPFSIEEQLQELRALCHIEKTMNKVRFAKGMLLHRAFGLEHFDLHKPQTANVERIASRFDDCINSFLRSLP
jgi:hypothetical protein